MWVRSRKWRARSAAVTSSSFVRRGVHRRRSRATPGNAMHHHVHHPSCRMCTTGAPTRFCMFCSVLSSDLGPDTRHPPHPCFDLHIRHMRPLRPAHENDPWWCMEMRWLRDVMADAPYLSCMAFDARRGRLRSCLALGRAGGGWVASQCAARCRAGGRWAPVAVRAEAVAVRAVAVLPAPASGVPSVCFRNTGCRVPLPVPSPLVPPCGAPWAHCGAGVGAGFFDLAVLYGFIHYCI